MPNAYVLPVHQAVTPYEWYAMSGQCELTDSAYHQCVDWKQSNYKMHQLPRYHVQNPVDAYQNGYVQEVVKVNSKSGMAYVDRKYNKGKYQTPTYGRLDSYAAPRDLYRGTSTLPVSITDSYGLSRNGVKLVTDKGYNTKDVTIKNKSSGLSNTIRLKNSQQVVHVKELDKNNDYIDDTQVLTICDDETNTCDVVSLDLTSPYVDPAYVDHAYEEIEACDAAYPHASVGEPMLIDPLSVGADADDVCWLEDVIVGSDMYGDAIIESEVFCADAGDLYVEPLTAYAPETAPGYVAPAKAAPQRERGIASKPKPQRPPPSKPAAAPAAASASDE